MESKVLMYTYKDQAIQRVHRVDLDSFDQLQILKPIYNRLSYVRLTELYKDFIIKKYRKVFGKIMIYTLPKDIEIPFCNESEEYGISYDPYLTVTATFKRDIYLKENQICFRNQKTEDFYQLLLQKDCVYVAMGERNSLSFLPVSYSLGFLSETKENASVKVNSSFFVMDKLDCDTPYDVVGTPIGLHLKDGVIYNPPLFDREALMVQKDGSVQVKKVSLSEIDCEIDGVVYKDKVNCRYYCRPEHRKTPEGGCDLVIVNNKVVALKKGGNSHVCSGGFVIHLDHQLQQINNKNVTYHGFEDLKFAIQVGNSVAVDGVKTERFISKFYNFLLFFIPSYPPSMYPLNYKKSRAPRMVIGSTKDNHPVLLWFEGAGKFGYQKGKDSAGASLMEVSDICQKEGIVNGVHLDGGGSAQILLNNKRLLMVSDRQVEDFKEKERAVSLGLYVE